MAGADQSKKVCDAHQFSNLSPLFRHCCHKADVIAGPEEARQWARMEGSAFKWLRMQLGHDIPRDEWLAFVRAEALEIHRILRLYPFTISS